MSKGFTLIEILVSVAIMALVFGVIISSTNGVRRSSRNAQRQADLRNMQSSLQQYYADQSFFPTTLSTTITNCTGNVNTPCTVSKTYLKTVPTDPNTAPAYIYQSAVSATDATVCVNATCNYYYLCAYMEVSSPQSAGQYSTCAGISSGVAGTTYNFQLNPS